MAAKGTVSKSVVFDKLKEVFPESFWEDEGKILRIPMSEGSGVVEIKVTLTAAKSNMGSGELKSAFGAAAPSAFGTPTERTVSPAEVTEEEKQNVADLIAALNL